MIGMVFWAHMIYSSVVCTANGAPVRCVIEPHAVYYVVPYRPGWQRATVQIKQSDREFSEFYVTRCLTQEARCTVGLGWPGVKP